MKDKRSKISRNMNPVLSSISLVWLIFGLFLLAWRLWPPPIDANDVIIPKGDLPAAPDGEHFATISDYQITVSWPRWIRRGEKDIIKLSLIDLDHQSSAGDHAQIVQIVSIEPIAHPLNINPQGSLQVHMGDEQNLYLEWEISGDKIGSYPGKIYFYFNFYDESNQNFIKVPAAVIDFEIKVTDLWGLTSGAALWIGFIALLFWGIFLLLAMITVLKRQ